MDRLGKQSEIFACISDILYIKKGTINKSQISGNNIILTIGSGTITLVGANGKQIKVKDSSGNITSKTYTNQTFSTYTPYSPTAGSDGAIRNVRDGVVINGTAGKDKISIACPGGQAMFIISVFPLLSSFF